LALRQGHDLTGEIVAIDVEPLDLILAGGKVLCLFELGQGLRSFADSDLVANLDLEGWNVDLATVDLKVAVANDLTGLAPAHCEAETVGDVVEAGLKLLEQQFETRLDNVAYRLGFAMSRRQARQVVRHGHLQVNGRKVNIPSFQVKVGDEIAIREGSKTLPQFEEAKNFAAGQNQVQWLDINRDNLSGKVMALPKREDV